MTKQNIYAAWITLIEKYRYEALSRRSFLTTSVGIAAGSTIFGSLSGCGGEPAPGADERNYTNLPDSMMSYETEPSEAHRILAERHSSALLLGPPNSDDLLRLITHLYTREAAELVVQFPAKIIATLSELVEITGKSEQEIRDILSPVIDERHVVLEISRILKGMQGYAWVDDLLSLAGDLVDGSNTLLDSVLALTLPENFLDFVNETTYLTSPIVPPMFEANFMYGVDTPWHRKYADLYAKVFSSGYWQEYVRDNGELTILRTIPIEQSLDVALEVLNEDRFTNFVESVDDIVLLSCQCAFLKYLQDDPCRFVNKHPSKKPCIIAGPVAKTLIEMGWAEPATKQEVLDIRNATAEEGAIHITFNVVNSDCFYVCACCSCCCMLIQVIRDFECPAVIAQPRIVPQLNLDNCGMCKKCASFCQMNAQLFVDGGHAIDPNRCIGCGQCIRVCPTSAKDDSQKALTWVENENFREPQQMTPFLTETAVKILNIAQGVMKSRHDQSLIK